MAERKSQQERRRQWSCDRAEENNTQFDPFMSVYIRNIEDEMQGGWTTTGVQAEDTQSSLYVLMPKDDHHRSV